jgi:hypothetical protein
VLFLREERWGVNERRSPFGVFLLKFANAQYFHASKYTYLTLTFASSLAFAKNLSSSWLQASSFPLSRFACSNRHDFSSSHARLPRCIWDFLLSNLQTGHHNAFQRSISCYVKRSPTIYQNHVCFSFLFIFSFSFNLSFPSISITVSRSFSPRK